MGERWDETIDAIDVLTEQWDIITASEELPSNRLAANAHERRNLAQAMVDRLTPLRSHPATKDTSARQYLEAAITYWSALVTALEEEERYALDITTWGKVLEAQVSFSEAFVVYKQEECKISKNLYSNWEEICDEVEDTVQVAADLRARALFNRFRDTVIERWREVTGKIEDLREQADAIADESIPSYLLAEISGQYVEKSRSFLNFLQKLNDHPALDHASTERWYRTVIAYWDQELKYSEALNAYALDRVEWSSVEQTNDRRSTAYSAYLEAECTLSRLHEYADADSVCALAGR